MIVSLYTFYFLLLLSLFLFFLFDVEATFNFFFPAPDASSALLSSILCMFPFDISTNQRNKQMKTAESRYCQKLPLVLNLKSWVIIIGRKNTTPAAIRTTHLFGLYLYKRRSLSCLYTTNIMIAKNATWSNTVNHVDIYFPPYVLTHIYYYDIFSVLYQLFFPKQAKYLNMKNILLKTHNWLLIFSF
jgi:hypothetical protein